ncbi:MAG: non-homologous end-joining DNA ligase [Actinomycetota bacterium]|nr:non-homologous end-joining DNA ligase [Actinomycetota bacterium]
MLATLTSGRFSSEDWIYERKLDGERCLAFKQGGRVKLYSRNRKPLNAAYPELVEALEGQGADGFVVDGEVVAFEGNKTSFSRLQRRIHVEDPERARRSGVPVYYYLFDLLYAYGYDVTRVPLRHRKALLKRLLDYEDPLRFLPHRNRDGERYYEEACRRGWEGVIAKRADGPYAHRRSPDWLKFKCAREQELVIGGFTEPRGSRRGLGALLVGYYEGEELRYAGKVGTGFDDRTLEKLVGILMEIEVDENPFGAADISEKGVHWVEPLLVAQVGFTEWTPDNRLRHPRYLGLRRDKRPREVRREVAEGRRDRPG